MWTHLIEFVYPETCPACDARLPVGTRGLCETCENALYSLGPSCRRCALPGSDWSDDCYRCRGATWPLKRAFSAYRYGSELGLALRKLKYQRRPDIARSLGPMISDTLRVAAATSDVIVPVPLHRGRLWAQGFNHAERLAHHAVPRVEIDRRSLRRVRATESQAGLPAARRLTNLSGAFAVRGWRKPRICGRKVLLFDDVMSTGATVCEAARALLEAGAAEVSAFAVARAEV